MTCGQCGREFEPTWRRGSPQRFCSPRCRTAAWRRRRGSDLLGVTPCDAMGGPRTDAASVNDAHDGGTSWGNVVRVAGSDREAVRLGWRLYKREQRARQRARRRVA